ncbi:hypothetical protein I5677_09560 [Mobilitalea sibirica]|uniref:NHL repeat-containing protein n=1 Tax=Mobilitalea sibirica TaxID=1462919 RepID=A0A8J7KT95_9FIRM|nr:tetratricopeptide repeat protein [Mobilitalea sibirica]MBH1941136.1 hypothetical protein [Mobilitalea sibirica]
MKRKSKVLAGLLLLITALTPVVSVSADASFYTYNYDVYDVELPSPDAYTAQDLLLGTYLGIGDFRNPKGLFVRGETIYVVDTGNNRIVVADKNFNLIDEITSVNLDGEESTFLNPQDIFVAENGDLYICDTDNNRVLHTDKNKNVIKVYTKPNDENFSADQTFIPLKAVADNTGRLYLLAGNVNKGFLEFDKDGGFTGYVGANKVKASFFQVIQKRLMTKEQRARMILFVPTEYSNLAIDQENFLYATTTTFTPGDLANNPDRVNPIRKINSLGDDVLVKNGYYHPIGDMQWGSGGDIVGPSRLEDITALDNDTYFALDRVRGRIFGYDFQGNMLYAFGGVGNKMGYFQYPVAIDHMGTDLLVLDNRAGSVTRFTLTEYGRLINDGLADYKVGRYEESAESFRKVLELNGNYDLAYIGIGRALLRQGEYDEAMKYFKSKRDWDSYSKAFQQYRKQWVEANIEYLIAGFFVIILLPKVVKGVRKLTKGGAQK